MKLTVLGSGTGVPDGDRNSAGYFVEAGDARVMLDCGAGTLHALARYDLPWEAMTHLFVSHFHLDHCGELASLFFAFKYGMKTERSEPLTLFGPEGIDRVVEALGTAFGSKVFDPSFPVRVKVLAPGASEQITEDVRLRVASTPHTPESLAVRIDQAGRSICYTGDTGVSEELPAFFKGASVLVSECSFRERRAEVSHLSIRDAALLAEQSNARALVLTHFYFSVSESELIEEARRFYSGRILVGRDGLQVSA